MGLGTNRDYKTRYRRTYNALKLHKLLMDRGLDSKSAYIAIQAMKPKEIEKFLKEIFVPHTLNISGE